MDQPIVDVFKVYISLDNLYMIFSTESFFAASKTYLDFEEVLSELFDFTEILILLLIKV